ncbi:low affinity immunoglobulin epsilon Fc receptor-like [Antedon mediterranea]|uniref:low affinity immunoglobulin epsilon Fc receptor-like n=1 Tax=Antedon mediterranea TaxID=105859 RepID=UPI003AF86F46
MGRKGYILLSIVIAINYVICYECPIGWSYNAAFLKCYRVTNTSASWTSGRERCQSFGGDLVEIGSEEENDWLDGILEYLAIKKAWIGLVDVDSNDEFEWLSGRISNYTNWAPSQPDLDNNEDCGILNNFSSGSWHDASCAYWQFPAICEQLPRKINRRHSKCQRLTVDNNLIKIDCIRV